MRRGALSLAGTLVLARSLGSCGEPAAPPPDARVPNPIEAFCVRCDAGEECVQVDGVFRCYARCGGSSGADCKSACCAPMALVFPDDGGQPWQREAPSLPQVLPGVCLTSRPGRVCTR
ncbi:MAG: hypothetical protein HY909_15515 [Deltaproteobacteria bacterium]|nr:hypothetical protein [Deltaproteobacteria bacterium]